MSNLAACCKWDNETGPRWTCVVCGRSVISLKPTWAQCPVPVRPVIRLVEADKAGALIGQMRESLQHCKKFRGLRYEDAVIETRLAVCQACDALTQFGCGIPCPCGRHWGKWQERIVKGGCPKHVKEGCGA